MVPEESVLCTRVIVCLSLLLMVGCVTQLRVDGVLMRLRDTRLHCLFGDHMKSVILRESCWREATFQALSSVSEILSLSALSVTTGASLNCSIAIIGCLAY